MTRKPLFAGNWKMNKRFSELSDYFGLLQKEVMAMAKTSSFDTVVAPSAIHLSEAKKYLTKEISLASQNCGLAVSGAFTGEISPTSIKELGVDWVILGHSERRHVFLESIDLISKRCEAALKESLNVIFCVGETLAERKSGATMSVVASQLTSLKKMTQRSLVTIAYEPVWAIGTGENATPEQAEEVHQAIRSWLSEAWSKTEAEQCRILYGGSAKPENSRDLMKKDNVDGLLVGGASL